MGTVKREVISVRHPCRLSNFYYLISWYEQFLTSCLTNLALWTSHWIWIQTRLIEIFNPDEGKLRYYLLDRIAISLSADSEELNIEQSVEAVNAVLDFSSSGLASKIWW